MENFLGTLAALVPLIFILLAANASERERSRGESGDGWRVVAYLLTIAVMLLIAALGALILFAGLLASAQPSLLGDATGVQSSLPANPILDAANPGLLGWGLMLAGVVGTLLLLPPVRRVLSRVIPIDAGNAVHAVALSFSMVVVVNMLFTVGLGLEQLSQLVTEQQAAGAGEMVTIGGLWAQQLLFALLGFIGVGWPIRRSLAASLDRLGLVIPSVGQVFLGMGLAAVLVGMVIAAQALGVLLGFEPNADVENITEQLLGGIFATPWGVLTIGLAAAIGEETLMRGAAQPRLGLVLTSFLFALLHSQYGITFSTWAVFAVGLVLGYIRIRHNTTTAMVTHATYNIILATLAYLSVDLLQQMSR
jgi:membrane protease YdiL (CAAX protease family)